MIYAIDTNIVSYFIREDENIISRFRAALAAGHSIIIPPVTYYEIRRGFKHKDAPKKEKAFDRMCTMFPIGEMSLSAWEQAADIYGKTRRAGNPVEDTDIINAAYCIVNGYTLVTNNEKHFDGIDDLIFENWIEINE